MAAAEGGGKREKRRTATVFDSVAGRIGPNGFLTEEQLASSHTMPLAPEEVLLRSNGNAAPAATDQHQQQEPFYNAESRLSGGNGALPDSDLLKAIHAYAADFYARSTPDGGRLDFKSLDETALIALGVLVEEAAREMLGENGDMALVEAAGLDDGGAGGRVRESRRTKHQIRGSVQAPPSPHYGSDGSDDEAPTDDDEVAGSPRKRRRGL